MRMLASENRRVVTGHLMASFFSKNLVQVLPKLSVSDRLLVPTSIVFCIVGKVTVSFVQFC